MVDLDNTSNNKLLMSTALICDSGNGIPEVTLVSACNAAKALVSRNKKELQVATIQLLFF
jgi:hypothetical protein